MPSSLQSTVKSKDKLSSRRTLLPKPHLCSRHFRADVKRQQLQLHLLPRTRQQHVALRSSSTRLIFVPQRDVQRRLDL